MNIFCNLATDRELKKELTKYVHNIFSGIRYHPNERITYNFAYNWFYSQQFEIITSLEKLVIQMLEESKATDKACIDFECMLWYRLAERRNNEIAIPLRIIEMDHPLSKAIRTEILGMPEDEAI
jgi:hypothetical protein